MSTSNRLSGVSNESGMQKRNQYRGKNRGLERQEREGRLGTKLGRTVGGIEEGAARNREMRKQGKRGMIQTDGDGRVESASKYTVKSSAGQHNPTYCLHLAHTENNRSIRYECISRLTLKKSILHVQPQGVQNILSCNLPSYGCNL